jgi:uncharacterized protein HemX
MTHLKLIAAALALGLAFLAGARIQAHIDEQTVTHARENEMQANGQEDECKQALEEARWAIIIDQAAQTNRVPVLPVQQ